MKIGVSSYSFGRYRRATGASLLDVCRKAKEMGFDAIESRKPKSCAHFATSWGLKSVPIPSAPI